MAESSAKRGRWGCASEDDMRKSRFTEEQIVGVLKEADAGRRVQDLCRKHGISEQM